MQDLAPGQSVALPLTFKVEAGGQQCHEVTVSATDATPVSKSACINPQQATIELTVTPPRSRVVGEDAEFSTVVKNVSNVAATNLEIVWKYDPALSPMPDVTQGYQQLPDGSVLLRLARLEAGERRPLRMVARCVSPGNNVCNRVSVMSGGQEVVSQDGCFEILPPRPGAAAAAATGLQVRFAPTPNPARVNETAQIQITVDNTGQQIERQVVLRVLLPSDLVPIDSQIQPPATLIPTANGTELRFQPVGELPPNQRLPYTIAVQPKQKGTPRILAQLAAASLQAAIPAESSMTIIDGSL